MYKTMTPNLMVENVDETVDFYKERLGFSLVTSVPDGKGGSQFAIVAKDDLTLMFQERTNLVTEYPILKTDRTHPSITLYIAVDNFEELYEEWKARPAVLCDVHETFYGSREFAIGDNNGYVLTFTESK